LADWAKILAFYRDLVAAPGWERAQPVLHLVSQIANSRYASVAAYTSHEELFIAQNEESLRRGLDRLHIVPRRDTLRFEFLEPYKVAWSRDCEPNEGFAMFEHCVRDLKRWFTP
jgi:hypothetical protein